MLKIKLFAVAAVSIFAVCALLSSGFKSRAQTNENAKNRDEVLEKIAGYKLWRQIQNPEKQTDGESQTEALPVLSAALTG